MGIGIAIFAGIGIPLSIISENIGLIGIGPAIGVAFGLAVGTAIEARYQKEGKIRALSEKEKKRKIIGITAGILILSLLALIFLILSLT